jgi:aminomethyltransferase
MKELVLHKYHASHSKMIEFAGFKMPLYYDSIIKEHLSVRNNVGLFDITHMGRAVIRGKDAVDFVNYITVNDVNRLSVGRAHYSLFCNEEGGIIDDLMVYRVGEEEVLLVYNAANREKDIRWINKHRRRFNVNVEDISDTSIMFALQGPSYMDVLSDIFSIEDVRFRVWNINYNSHDGWISTTGYTGERGVEIILRCRKEDVALNLWLELLDTVKKLGGLPCGLGARDSLRLEAGYCLYGNDINESINPYEANLAWVVKMDQEEFIGKKKLMKKKEEIRKIRVGFIIQRGMIKKGDLVYLDDVKIGYVTSAAYSPILRKGIGMGYINIENKKENLRVDIISFDEKVRKGVVKSFPLYDSTKYGWSRSV